MNLFSFKGRTGRLNFLLISFLSIFFVWGWEMFGAFSLLPIPVTFFLFGFFLVPFIILLPAVVRRLHDIGYNGVIGGVFISVLFFIMVLPFSNYLQGFFYLSYFPDRSFFVNGALFAGAILFLFISYLSTAKPFSGENKYN